MPPLLMLPRVAADRRVRFLLICLLFGVGGLLVETWFFPHYIAPFTACLYALGLQAMRHLRLWNPERRPVGVALVRLSVTLCIALASLRLWAEPLHLSLTNGWPSNYWFGSIDFGIPRAKVEKELEQMPGKQLVIVRYTPNHNVFDEWVFNAPDIDSAKVVWARDMDVADNGELIRYYKDRKVWLVEPDASPAKISPYPDVAQDAAQLQYSGNNLEQKGTEERRVSQ
jgi:hypothetical protein